jgi:hypothetical protein
MGIGLGIGINRSNYAQGIFNAYQSRVIADGGVTEAGACVDAVSGLLLTASLLLIPSGYKSGKAYAQIPTNGNGDLTWTRASTAVRTDSSGLLESMGSGVPRLDYSQGSCPALLLEPQRTNSIRNSTMVGAVAGSPGTLPTNYTNGAALSGFTRTVIGVGVENGLQYIDIRYNGNATNFFGDIFFEVNNNIASANGINWTASSYLKIVAAPAPPLDYGYAFRQFAAGNVFLSVTPSTTFPITSTLTRIERTFTTNQATVAFVQPSLIFSFTNGAAYDFTIRIAAPQMELGAYATTPIPTTTASATRVADAFGRNNIFTNGLITSSGGTWFVELKNNVALTRDTASIGLFIDTASGGFTNGFTFRNGGGANRLAITKCIAGTLTQLYTTTTDATKIAIKWNGTSADIFVNGVKQVTATAFTSTNMEFLSCSATDVPKFIQAMALYSTPLSDTDCTTLTTL